MPATATVGTATTSRHFAIHGDQLTIDMTQDTCPPCAPGELTGEWIAQTVIYESSPFTRQP
jgi:hypothetical protein